MFSKLRSKILPLAILIFTSLGPLGWATNIVRYSDPAKPGTVTHVDDGKDVIIVILEDGTALVFDLGKAGDK